MGHVKAVREVFSPNQVSSVWTHYGGIFLQLDISLISVHKLPVQSIRWQICQLKNGLSLQVVGTDQARADIDGFETDMAGL